MRAAEAASDIPHLARVDMDFHRAFVLSCPNGYLQAAYDLIRYQLIALRFRSPIPDGADSLQVLVDAIARGDIDGACAELFTHILNNEARYCVACNVA